MPQLEGLRWGPASGGVPGQLVVLCHGVGADGHDLIDLAPYFSKALPDAAFLAPHAPDPYDGAPMGRQWFSLADRTPAVLHDGAAWAAPLLEATIAAELARLRLPSGAVALMGFSQGAMMVLYAGLRRRPTVRAVLAYSGALLVTPELALECTARPPVLLVHGEDDEVVPFSRGPESEAVLRRLGVPVESVWRPGLDHGIDDPGLSAGALFLQRAFSIGPGQNSA